MNDASSTNARDRAADYNNLRTQPWDKIPRLGEAKKPGPPNFPFPFPYHYDAACTPQASASNHQRQHDGTNDPCGFDDGEATPDCMPRSSDERSDEEAASPPEPAHS